MSAADQGEAMLILSPDDFSAVKQVKLCTFFLKWYLKERVPQEKSPATLPYVPYLCIGRC